MNPARSIIHRLGGPTKVAQIVGVHRTRVHGWMTPRASGGTGGAIPLKHATKLLAWAAANDVALTANDFIPAAPPPAGDGAGGAGSASPPAAGEAA